MLFTCLHGRRLVLNFILKPLPIGIAKTILFCEVTKLIRIVYNYIKFMTCLSVRMLLVSAKNKPGKVLQRQQNHVNFVFMDKVVVKLPVVSLMEKKSSHIPVKLI